MEKFWGKGGNWRSKYNRANDTYRTWWNWNPSSGVPKTEEKMHCVIPSLLDIANILMKPFQRAKPITLHISLLFFILVYAFIGGLIFSKLESDALDRQQKEKIARRISCAKKVFFAKILSILMSYSFYLEQIFNEC